MIVISAINNVVFWGAVRMDLIGWTHLADWSLPVATGVSRSRSGSAHSESANSRWVRIWESITRSAQWIAATCASALEPHRAFRWFATAMVALLLAMFGFAALYRDQLLALAGMANVADATPMNASLDQLRKFSLLIAAVSTFLTVLIAGVFPFRLARYLWALLLACSAVALLVVVALIVGAQSCARAALHMSHAWFDALQRDADDRRSGRRLIHPNEIEPDATSDDIGTGAAATSVAPNSRWVSRHHASSKGRIRARRTQQQ